MKLEWQEIGKGDFAAEGNASYDIEQASNNRWWAFKDDSPVGIYASLDEAKQRCQTLEDTK